MSAGLGAMRPRSFVQVDVFGDRLYAGNPVAVVLDGEGLVDEEMLALARWTNLSETTFVLPPAASVAADYHVRIFTTTGELPFAGHPTLGTCHAWLDGGGVPADDGVIVQQCALGPIRLRRGDDAMLSFAAPPAHVADVPAERLEAIVGAVGVDRADVQWSKILDNGPGWHVLALPSSDAVLALEPDLAALAPLANVGVVGPHPPGHDAQFEVRAFAPAAGAPEDPVTGSLNAALGQWLIGEGLAPSRYVATQGSRLRRAGRVHIDADGDDVWVGGATTTGVAGTVTI